MSELFLVASNGGVYVFDLEEGKAPLVQLKDSDGDKVVNVVGNVVCSAGISKALLNFWKVTEKSVNPFYKVSVPEKLTAIEFSRDGNFLFAGSANGTIFVWHTFTGSLLRQWSAHFSGITSIVVDEERGLVITASSDTHIKMFLISSIFEDTNPQAIKSVAAHSASVTKLVLTESILVSCGDDKSVNVYSFPELKQLRNFALPCIPSVIAVDGPATELYVGGDDGKMYVFSVSDIGDSSVVLDGHASSMTGLIVSQDSSRIVSCASDGIRVWDSLTRQTIRTITVASMDKHMPTGLSSFIKDDFSHCYVPQLKPLQRVLTDIATIESSSITLRTDAMYTKNVIGSIYEDEERELVRSGDALQQMLATNGKSIQSTELVQELAKQKEMTIMWMNKYETLLAEKAQTVQSISNTLPTRIIPSK